MVDLDLKEIVHELGDVAWCEGKNFEDLVEPRVNAILQALSERDALKAELEAAKENHRIHAARLISEKILVSEHLEAARKQEPCGWQCRFITPTETWGYCSKEHYETVKAAPHEYPGYEVRALYARPVPAQQPMPWPDQRPDFAGGG